MLPLTMYCTFCFFLHFVCDQIPAQTTLCQSNSNWHESVRPSESLVIIMHSLKALTYTALRKSVLSFCHGKLDGLRAKHLSLHRLKRFSMQANQTTTHTTLTKDIINKHTPVNLTKITKSKWQTVVVKKVSLLTNSCTSSWLIYWNRNTVTKDWRQTHSPAQMHPLCVNIHTNQSEYSSIKLGCL